MTTTKLLVLGCINRRNVAHGYEVYRDLLAWRADTWACVKPGSIYHAIAKLEKEEAIISLSTEHGMRGGSRTKYRLTAKGKRLLTEGVKHALASLEMDEFSAGLAFMDSIDKKEAINISEKRLTNLRDIQTFMHSLPTDSAPSSPDKQTALVGYWADFFDFNVKHAENFLKAQTNKKEE